jgi:choice-of-anchor B domain-containing protein
MFARLRSARPRVSVALAIVFTLPFVQVLPTRQALGHDDEDGDKGDLTTGGEGSAAGTVFAAVNINQLGHVPKAVMGAGASERGSDLWGWTDSVSGDEYALVGMTNGTAFVDVSDPVNPVYLGRLPTHTGSKAWRDIKVYADHAYIVSDSNGAHGMQIFDLTRLRNVSGPPLTFTEDARYSGFNEAHNIVINEDSGFAYAVGGETDAGGLHILDLSNPISPVHVGSYAGDGYTHDAQVVTYHGPDTAHQGREIALAFNENTVTIVDVNDKTAPVQLSRTGYPNVAYTHQGWLTEDHAYLLQNDENDEKDLSAVDATRTHVWNVQDLDIPIYIGFDEHSGVESIDHNLYTLGNLAFEGNYTSGMRVVDISNIAASTADVNGRIDELDTVAWIDTHPAKDSRTSFDGVWSVYPYFSSGNILIGDRNEGLIIVSLDIPEPGTFALIALASIVPGRRSRKHGSLNVSRSETRSHGL